MLTTITITLLDMPTPSEWDNFERFMNDHKGLQPVVVETPDGSITLDSQHHISMDHQPEIGMIFGGAGLAIAASEVDADDVMSGVSL